MDGRRLAGLLNDPRDDVTLGMRRFSKRRQFRLVQGLNARESCAAVCRRCFVTRIKGSSAIIPIGYPANSEMDEIGVERILVETCGPALTRYKVVRDLRGKIRLK